MASQLTFQTRKFRTPLRDRYYTRISNKLNDSHVFPKAYWLILKMFLNNKKNLIIPFLLHENRFLTDFYKEG